MVGSFFLGVPKKSRFLLEFYKKWGRFYEFHYMEWTNIEDGFILSYEKIENKIRKNGEFAINNHDGFIFFDRLYEQMIGTLFFDFFFSKKLQIKGTFWWLVRFGGGVRKKRRLYLHH